MCIGPGGILLPNRVDVAEVFPRFGVVVSLVVVVVSGFLVVVLAGEAEWAVDCPGAGGDGGSPDGVLGVPGGLAVWVDQVGWGFDEVANDGVETSVDFGLGCPDEPGSVGLGCRMKMSGRYTRPEYRHTHRILTETLVISNKLVAVRSNLFAGFAASVRRK